MNQKLVKPYIFRMNSNYPYKSCLVYDWHNRKTDQYIFMEGKELPYQDKKSALSENSQCRQGYDLIFDSRVPENKLAKWDVLENTTPGIVVNKRCLDLLKVLCPNDFQAFSIEIRSTPSVAPPFVDKCHFLLNLTKKVDVVDFERSQIEYWPHSEETHAKSFERLVFKENSMFPAHFARVNIYTPLVVVSPELVNLFKQQKIRGATFCQDFEY